MQHSSSKNHSGQKRKQFWVDAPLQLQILGNVLLLVTSSLLLVSLSVHRGLHGASAESHQIFHSLEWIDQAIRPPLLLSSAISILVAALVTLVWSHRIAGPLRVLSAAMHRVSKGNFSSHIGVRSTDSLKDLIGEFSKMQGELRERAKADRDKLDALSGRLQRIADELPEDDAAQAEMEALLAEIKAVGSQYQL